MSDDITAKNPEVAIATLQQEYDSMLTPMDYPGDWSIRQVDNYTAKRSELFTRIHVARTAWSAIREIDAALSGLVPWHSVLVSARKSVCDKLLATYQPPGRERNLTLSLEVIDAGIGAITGSGYHLQTLYLGDLLKDAGYVPLPAQPEQTFGEMPWYGSLPEVTAQIADLQKRREVAARQLCELLLDDEGRTRLAAENAERIRELNSRPIRKTRGDGSQYDKYPDGRRVEVTG